MDAEHPGQQSGWEFGAELEQRRGSGLSGSQPEVAESFGEAVGADVSFGLASGEQRPRGALVTEAGVAATGGDELLDQAGERFGQLDGFVTEEQPDGPVVRGDVVDGELADGCGPLP